MRKSEKEFLVQIGQKKTLYDRWIVWHHEVDRSRWEYLYIGSRSPDWFWWFDFQDQSFNSEVAAIVGRRIKQIASKGDPFAGVLLELWERDLL